MSIGAAHRQRAALMQVTARCRVCESEGKNMQIAVRKYISPSVCSWVWWSLNEAWSGALLAHCSVEAGENACAIDR